MLSIRCTSKGVSHHRVAHMSGHGPNFGQRMCVCHAVSEVHHAIKRPTNDDVQRLSMGKASKSERGWGSRQVCHRLNQEERKAYDIALQKGYLTLKGTGYRKERKGSPLANIYRQYCDARDMLCVNVLLRQHGGQQGDVVLVDMTPKRRWMRDVENSGMVDSAMKEAIERGVDDVIKTEGWEASRVACTRDMTPWTVLLPPFLLLDDDEEKDEYDVLEHYSQAPMWQIPPHVLAYSVASRPEAKALAAAISQQEHVFIS
ncbi:hypothetical protein M9435_003082 [Picochlorum sp. BPE23]|nr:hypothetical protein M9435_003082 [Picochlorum sp. BPE23]